MTIPIASELVHTISKLLMMFLASSTLTISFSVTMLPSVIMATADDAFVIALIPATTVLAAINPANPKATKKID